MKRILLASVVAAAFAASTLQAETCLSPYIKGLRAPEKVMYLWTLPVGEGPDFLSVIDVNVASPTYGKILKKVEVGSKGNEAHHMGYSDDRTKILLCGDVCDRVQADPQGEVRIALGCPTIRIVR